MADISRDPRSLRRDAPRRKLYTPPALPVFQGSAASRNLQKGTLGLRAAGRGALAASGAAVGAEDFARGQLEQAKGLRQRAAEIKPGGVEDIADIHGVRDALSFAGTQITKNLPGIVTTVASALPAAKLAKTVAKIRGASKTAQKTAQTVGAGTGVVGAVGVQETGEIFPAMAEDPEAKGTLAEQGRAAIAGGTLAGSLELLPVYAVFKKMGIGKAAKQSILKRAAKGAGVGALSEAPVEAAQTFIERATHKFVNDNIDLFSDEALHEYLNAAAAGFAVGGAFGGVGGVAAPSLTTQDRFDDKIAEFEADEELNQTRAEQQKNALNIADPGSADALTAEDMFDPDVQSGVQVAYSRKFGRSENAAARIARSFLPEDSELGAPENKKMFEEQIVPFIAAIVRGDPPKDKAETARRKKIEGILRTHFARTEGAMGEDGTARKVSVNTYDDMLQAVAKFEGSRSFFEDAERVDAEQVSAEELDSPAAATAAGFQIRVDTPDNRSITLNKTGSPWKSRALTTKLSNKDFGDTSLDRALEKRNEQDTEKLYRKVSYREFVTEQMINDGVPVNEREAKLVAQAEAFAAEQMAADPRLQAVYDPNNPVAFMEQFDAVESIPVAELAGEVDRADLSLKDSREIMKGASHTKKALPRGDFQVDVDGVTMNVNSADLIKKMMGKVPATQKGLSAERVGELFATGVSSLLNLKGKEVTLKGKLPKDLVIFTTKGPGGREFTLGEAEVSGAAKLNVRMERTKAVRDKFPEGSAEYARFDAHYQQLGVTRRKLRFSLEKKQAAETRKELEAIVQEGEVEESRREGRAEQPTGGATASAEIVIKTGKMQDKIAAAKAAQKKITPKTTLAQAKAIFKEAIGVPVRNVKTVDDVVDRIDVAIKNTRDKIKALQGEAVQRQKEETSEVPKVSFSRKLSKAETEKLEADRAERLRVMKKIFATQDAEVAKKAKGLVNKWAKSFGMEGKVDILFGDEAARQMIKVFTSSEIIKFIKGTTRGIAVTGKGKTTIFLNPSVKADIVLEVIGHEFGHAIHHQGRQRVAASPEKRQAVIDAYERWRAQHKPHLKISDVARGRMPYHMFEDVSHLSKEFYQLPSEFQEYMLSFDEWFADNVAKWLTTDAKPLGIVEEFFADIALKMKALFKALKAEGFTADESVSDLMNAMFNRKVEPVKEDVVWEAVEETNSVVVSSEAFKSDLTKFIEKATGREVRYVKSPKGAKIIFSNTEKVVYVAHSLQNDPTGKVFNEFMQAAADVLFTPQERKILYNAFTSDSAQAQLKRLLKGDPAAQEAVKNNVDAALAYGFQFWRSGELTLGPKTKSVFGDVYNMLRAALGFVSEQAQVNEINAELQQGTLALRNKGESTFVVRTRLTNTRVQRAVAAVLDTSNAVMPFVSRVFYAGDWAMRRTKNPFMTKIADLIQPVAGSQGKAEGMFEARTRFIGSFVDSASNIFTGKSEAFGKKVLELLQNPDLKPGNDSEAKAVRKVRALLQTIRTYAVSKGVEMGDKGKDYFPWVFDPTFAMENGDKFIRLLSQEKYAEKVAAITKAFNAKLKAEAIAKAIAAGGVQADAIWTPIKAEDLPSVIYSNIVASNGYADVAINIDEPGHIPRMDSANTRSLGWVSELGNEADKATLAEFFNKNLGHTMMAYIEQTVKRAEYVHRFGSNSELLNTYLAKAEAAGATAGDLEVAKNYLDAVMGVSGLKLNPKLEQAYELIFGEPLTERQSVELARKMRKVQGNVMVYVNFMLLGMSAFTSLADVVGIAVRGGDIETPFVSYKAGIKELYNKVKGNNSELRALAETLGTINKKMANEALGFEFGGIQMTGTARKANEALFKYNGLQGLTRLTRLMALEGAQAFILKHKDGTYNKHSARYLEQLNLDPSDIKVDANGKLVMDDKMAVALNRFVDESILRPNAAQRPIWASDPHWALVFHLKQFMYSFQDRILARTYRETMEGNAAPILLLSLWIPAMIGADFLRELVQYGADGNPRKRNWGTMDYISHGAQRSGLYGITQMGGDALNDIKFGGIGVESFLGPTAGQLGKIPKLFSMDDNKQWDRFSNFLPAQNVYKHWNLGGDFNEQTAAERYNL